ncbi:MAG: hypothetical protein PHR56_09655, partial [Dehalococcoidales bacterium]|nr:hypothetical protein [Dehalococcoidales bacterium]
MVKKLVYMVMLAAFVCALAVPAAFAAEKAPAASGSELLVADFDSGEKPNNIGGDFGAWSKDPTDFSQGCTEAFDSVNRYGTKG